MEGCVFCRCTFIKNKSGYRRISLKATLTFKKSVAKCMEEVGITRPPGNIKQMYICDNCRSELNALMRIKKIKLGNDKKCMESKEWRKFKSKLKRERNMMSALRQLSEFMGETESIYIKKKERLQKEKKKLDPIVRVQGNPGHSNHFLEYFYELLKDREMTDVTLQCGDSQFDVHSVVLSAFSKYFQTVLSTTEADDIYHVDISSKNLSKETVSMVLEYLYTGEVVYDEILLREAAVILDIPSLLENITKAQKATKSCQTSVDSDVDSEATDTDEESAQYRGDAEKSKSQSYTNDPSYPEVKTENDLPGPVPVAMTTSNIPPAFTTKTFFTIQGSRIPVRLRGAEETVTMLTSARPVPKMSSATPATMATPSNAVTMETPSNPVTMTAPSNHVTIETSESTSQEASDLDLLMTCDVQEIKQEPDDWGGYMDTTNDVVSGAQVTASVPASYSLQDNYEEKHKVFVPVDHNYAAIYITDDDEDGPASGFKDKSAPPNKNLPDIDDIKEEEEEATPYTSRPSHAEVHAPKNIHQTPKPFISILKPRLESTKDKVCAEKIESKTSTASLKQTKKKVQNNKQIIIPLFNCQLCNKNFLIKEFLDKHRKSVHPAETNQDVPTVLEESASSAKERKFLGKSLTTSSVSDGGSSEGEVDYRAPENSNNLITGAVTENTGTCTAVKGSDYTVNSEVMDSKSSVPVKKKSGHCCEYCDKSFKSKIKLSRHFRASHSIGPKRSLLIQAGQIETSALTGNDERPETAEEENTDSKTGSLCLDVFSGDPIADDTSTPAVQDVKKRSTPKGIVKLKIKPLYNCKQCKKRFCYKTTLEKHIHKVHVIGKPKKVRQPPKPMPKIECEFCGKIYSYPERLDNHIQLWHVLKVKKPKDRRRFIPCYLCGEKFWGKVALAKHKEEKHTEHNCDYCGKKFDLRKKLKWHLRSAHRSQVEEYEHKNASFLCDICGQGFSRKNLLTFHRKYKHIRQTHKCTKCSGTFVNRIGLFNHMRISHAVGRVYVAASVPGINKCKICDSVLQSAASLRRHVRDVHGNGDLTSMTCTFCGETFENGGLLKRHRLREHGARCQTCRKWFSSEESCIKHGERCKGDDDLETSLCDVCGRSFGRKSSLTKHKQFAHTDYGPFLCDICGVSYDRKSSLVLHKKYAHVNKVTPGSTCSGEVKCSKCSEIFADAASLDSHMRLIHRVQESPCTICDAVCGSRASLARHMSKLHGCKLPRKINTKCHVCGDPFTSYSDLKKHKQNFHEENDLKCDLCEKEFKNSHSYKLHKYRYHPQPGTIFQCGNGCAEEFELYNDCHKHKFSCPFVKKRTDKKVGKEKDDSEYESSESEAEPSFDGYSSEGEVDHTTQEKSDYSVMQGIESTGTCDMVTEKVDTFTVTTEEINTCTAVTEEINTCTVATEEMNTCTVVTEEINTCTLAKEDMNTCTVAAEEMNTCTVAAEEMNTCTVVTEEMNTCTAVTEEINTCTLATEEMNTCTVAAEEMNTCTAVTEEINTCTLATEDMNTCTVVAEEMNTCNVVTEDMNTCTVDISEILGREIPDGMNPEDLLMEIQ